MKLFLKILFFIFTMIIIMVGETKSSTVTTILREKTSYSFIQKSQLGDILFENHNTNYCLNEENVVVYSERSISIEGNVAKGGSVLELTQNGKLFGRFTRGKNLEIIDDIPLYGGNKIELTPNTTTSVTGVLDDVNIVARRGVNADGSFNGITAAGAANEGGINILRSPEWGKIQTKYKSILDSGDELGYWKKVTDEFWETVNKPWLDEAIARGDNFRFVSNPTSDVSIYVTRGESLVLDGAGNKIKSIFGREIDYLQSKGYKILSDGTAVK